MDARDMTPEQLRSMAEEMERETGGVDADEHERRIRVIRGDEPEAETPGYIRHVEIDGIGLDVDMRRVGDLRTLRLVAKVQRGGDDELDASLSLADFVFGDQREKVERAVTDKDGFVSGERYVDFFLKVFKAVNAKN